MSGKSESRTSPLWVLCSSEAQAQQTQAAVKENGGTADYYRLYGSWFIRGVRGDGRRITKSDLVTA